MGQDGTGWKAGFSADAIEWIEERAAILEYDAGLERRAAERKAINMYHAWVKESAGENAR